MIKHKWLKRKSRSGTNPLIALKYCAYNGGVGKTTSCSGFWGYTWSNNGNLSRHLSKTYMYKDSSKSGKRK